MNFTFHSYAHLFERTQHDIYCQFPPPTEPSWLDVIPGLAPAIRQTRVFAHGAKMMSLINERWHLFGTRTATLRECFKPGELVSELEGGAVESQIRNARLVLVNGWTFRAPLCVQRHRETLRSYFRPITKHLTASQKVVEQLRQHADVVIGVHIRRGDYSNWRNGRYFFPVQRYAEWMTQLAAQFGERKVSFLVCSNEPRSPAEFQGLNVGFSTGLPIEDLYALAECDYIMGPVSSFTQWASFYGNKPLLCLTSADMQIERKRFAVSTIGEVPH